MRWNLLEPIRDRLNDERGTLRKQASRRIALCYPSPYHVGMSSLGFQTIYREIHAHEETTAERAFLPDDVDAWRSARAPLVTYEGEQPVGGCDVIAFSVAYELEVTGLFDCLALAGLPLHAAERGPQHPLVVAGGPLTFSNPLPLGAFVDVVIVGEAEELAPALLAAIDAEPDRAKLLAELSRRDGFWVPSIHGE
ncbi:MAG TPA: radical SAM protein, partial [Myxococcales bacterium]